MAVSMAHLCARYICRYTTERGRIMTRAQSYWLAGTAIFLLAGCATTTAEPQFKGLPPVSVQAIAETAPVGTNNADAADDPAIWRNRANPAASLIVATDKKAGLYVYGLDGKVKSFLDAGRVNNVDLVEKSGIIYAVASDRNDPANAKLALFTLDTTSGKLTALGKVAGGTGEGYGVCILPGNDPQAFNVFSVLKNGTIADVRVTPGATPTGTIVRTLKLQTQTEGCAVDAKTNSLYVGEEDVGIWRFDATGTGTQASKVASVDNQQLVADVEGLSVSEEANGTRYMVASSQGDNAYAVYRITENTGALDYVGRFAITDGALGGAEETDGLELVIGDFGPAFPGGLFVAQDGLNGTKAQNFKMTSWDAIKSALGL